MSLCVVKKVLWWRFHGGHGGCGGRRGGHFGRRWGRSGVGSEGLARAAGEVLKRRLDVDEEQEPIIDHALGDLRAALKELKGELEATHAPLADALRGDKIDDGALAAIFTRHDDALSKARRQVVSAVKQVHAVLDEGQRKKAADLLASAKGPLG